MFFDPLYFVFIIPGVLLSLWAQSKVKRTFQEYSQVPNAAGITGAQTGREVLDASNLSNVAVEPVPGVLSDHYDPRTKVLALSEPVYGGRSISAMAVAAHEAGHALQDAQGYSALVIRTRIVPLAAIGSRLGFIIFFAGLILQLTPLTWVGIALFGLSTIFTLVTLPVEFNASKRAKQRLHELGLVSPTEAAAVDKVLDAAAWTYVAAFLTSALSLLYYMNVARRS